MSDRPFVPLDAFTHARDHSSRVVPLWVNGSPPHRLSLSDSTVSFGGRLINTPSEPMKLTLTNTGFNPLTFSEFQIDGDDFAIVSELPVKLPAGKSVDVYLTFTPSSYTAITGKLVIKTTRGLTYEVVLEGIGIWDHIAVVDLMLNGLWDFIKRAVRPALVSTGPQVSLSNTTVLFADLVEVGAESGVMTLTITNAGNRDLVISDLTISGDYEIIP